MSPFFFDNSILKDDVSYFMNGNRIARMLLAGAEVSECDAARLTLEAIENLGELAQGLKRVELLALLRRVIQDGVAAVKAAEHTVPLREAAWASVEARSNLRPSTRRDLRHFVRRMLRVEGVADKPLRSMTTADCKHILASAFAGSPSSYKKGRAILSSVFSYGIRREWVAHNPVARIDVPIVHEKTIEPLTPTEVKKLLRTAEQPRFRDMRLSLSLMLFGGIRPAEVSRLQVSDVNWSERQVLIRPQISKTGGGRVVPLRGIGSMAKSECCIPRNWGHRWRALRRAAGFSRWVPDLCRHTFASYHAAMYRNLPELQLIMGHRDSALLRFRYMMPTLRQQAADFWSAADKQALLE